METAQGKGRYFQFQILNLAGLVIMVLINFLANYLPINGLDTGYISDLYPNLFAPAGFTFAIWGLIYLMLGIFAVYQAKGIFGSKGEENIFVNRIGYLFFVSCLLNSAWIFAWHYLQIGFSLIIMILLFVILLLIYYRINFVDKKRDKEGYLFISPAFSIYTGWITIATVANITTFLVNRGWGGFGLSEVFWMVIVLLIATGIVAAFTFKNKDWLYTLVAVWAFFGILVKRLGADTVSGWVIFAVVLCLVILLGTVFLVFREKSQTGKVI